MKIVFKPFDTLLPEELYLTLRLRMEAFVLEQQCFYLDLDNFDQKAIHALGYAGGHNLAATARLFAPGDYFDEYASVGRIVTAKEYRRKGYGKHIVVACVEKLRELYGNNCPIKIAAQVYLARFYESLGFTNTHEEFMEDGIPHVYMTC